MKTPFEGTINVGTVFRHTGFDIRCRVVKAVGGWIDVETLDCEGNVSGTTFYRTDLFRNKWLPERRSIDRWAEVTV